MLSCGQCIKSRNNKGAYGFVRYVIRPNMSVSLSARSRVEAMHDKWDAADRQSGQAPPPALGRRRQADASGRSPHLKRPPGGRRQHGGRVPATAAAAPNSLEVEFPVVQRFTFVPSLGISPSALGRRPAQQHRCCQKCLPISRAGYSDQSSSSASGVKDLLVVEPKSNSLLAKLFPSIAYMNERDMNYSLTGYEVVDQVVKSERVSNGVRSSTAAEVERAGSDVDAAEVEARQESRAGHIIKTMAAIIYKRMIRVAGVVLVHVFRRLFQGFYVHLGQINTVKEAAKKGYPLAFLPTHKSHLDYLLVTFALASMDIKVPHIAAGENLNIPVFSWLQRHLGGFFIKRRLDNGNGKDVLYRAVLHEYMEQLLKNGQNIEFFLEGSRSRTGKPIHPKGGLLSVLVDSVMEGTIPDIYIVPVDISYDKIFEGGLRRELMGQPKVNESLWQAVCSIWRMLSTRLGLVRLNMSQPFSLREYITSHVIFDSPWQVQQKSYSEEEGKRRKLVSALAHHVVHDFQWSASAMATSMVAFLLLTKHRKGVSRGTLISSYSWLAMELKARNRPLAFCGPASCAVSHAEKYLQDEVVHCAPGIGSGPNKEVFYPNLTTPSVLGLVHHKNQIISAFLMESVVACAMQALLTNQGQKMEEGPIISRDELLEAAVHLCGILSREFIFTQPCVHIEGAISDAVEALVSRGVLGSREEVFSSSRERNLHQALSQQCSWNDNDDEDVTDELSEHWLQVIASAESLEHLSFLQTILEPFVESYWLAAYSLLTMEGQQSETELVKAIHSRAVERIQTGTASYAETLSIDPLRNAVLRYKEMGLICETPEATIAVVDSSKLQDLTMDLVEFCR